LCPAKRRGSRSRIARQFLNVTARVVPLGMARGTASEASRGVPFQDIVRQLLHTVQQRSVGHPLFVKDLPRTTQPQQASPLGQGETSGGLLMQPPQLIESGPWRHLTSDGIPTEHNVDRALAPDRDSSNDACWDPAKRSR